MRQVQLSDEYEYLDEDHTRCRPEVPDHPCRCFVSPPCAACAECPAFNPEAWVESCHWKVACVNWSTPGIVHFVAYFIANGGLVVSKYFMTFTDTWAWLDEYGPKFITKFSKEAS